MGHDYASIARLGARQHGAVSARQLERAGISPQLRSKWIRRHLLIRAGPRSFYIAGSEPTWRREAWAAAADAEGFGLVGGRTAARLNRLDGFGPSPTEVLLHRSHRSCRLPYVTRSTSTPLENADTVMIDGIRCLTAHRLIVESPLFGFTLAETENAIDSAVRQRRVFESLLREDVLGAIRPGVGGGRQLREALVDTGGESRLERWFLTLCRDGGIDRPTIRVICRAAGGFAARLDATFPGRLVVELEGHRTHSSRQQRQHDEARRTELTLLGHRVLVFTYNDVRDRPEWVLDKLRRALALDIAS